MLLKRQTSNLMSKEKLKAGHEGKLTSQFLRRSHKVSQQFSSRVLASPAACCAAGSLSTEIRFDRLPPPRFSLPPFSALLLPPPPLFLLQPSCHLQLQRNSHVVCRNVGNEKLKKVFTFLWALKLEKPFTQKSVNFFLLNAFAQVKTIHNSRKTLKISHIQFAVFLRCGWGWGGGGGGTAPNSYAHAVNIYFGETAYLFLGAIPSFFVFFLFVAALEVLVEVPFSSTSSSDEISSQLLSSKKQ